MRRLMLVCCVLSCGCASFRDAWNQDMLYWRMCAEADRVWSECRHGYPEDQLYADDFQLGFKDGYIAVAFGANGCPPTLPRDKYWKPRYKNAEGKARIAVWYNGYAAGAYAALSTGVQDWNRLPTASEMYGRHTSGSDQVGTAILTPTPTGEPLPPEPEAGPPPGTPPAAEPLPLEALPPSAWRSASPAATDAVQVENAAFESEPEANPDWDVEIEQLSAEEPGLSGAFGLSRPE